jgi:hypothetical protein
MMTVIASEAKQSISPQKSMDCFVASLLAMTADTSSRPATRRARVFHEPFASKKRAWGMPGARRTRSLACKV